MSFQQTLDDLKSMEYEKKLKSIKKIKNSIIGNQTKKIAYLSAGVIPLIIDILKEEQDVEILCHATAALGSFGHGTEQSVKEVIKNGGIEVLFKSLNTKNPKIIQNSTRSLKILYSSNLVPKEILITENYVLNLLNLLGKNDFINEIILSLMSKCIQSKKHQEEIYKNNGVEKIEKFLDSRNIKLLGGCLECLVQLTKDNKQITKTLKHVDDITNLIVHKDPIVRLLSCQCIVNFYKNDIDCDLDISEDVLPVIIKLLNENGKPREQTPLVLANLVTGNEELQQFVCDSDAIEKISSFLTNQDQQLSETMKYNCLFSLAEMCSLIEEGRKKIIDSNVLPLIVDSLAEENEKIKLVACKCIKGLSRSSPKLRSTLLDSGVTRPLLMLMEHSSDEIKSISCACVCNVIVDFSPMKNFFIEKNGVEILVKNTNSLHSLLKLNSIWALKNLAFRSTVEIKKKILESMTAKRIFELLKDDDSNIQEQCLKLLSNIAHGNYEDIAYLIKELNDQLIPILIDKLKSNNNGVIIQTLYVISNISAGDQKDKIMKSNILKFILNFLQSSNKHVKVAALWVLINLTWKGDKGVEERKKIINELECEQYLKGLTNDSELDVRDRVKQVLDQLK
eukprot:gene4568-7952_t